MDDSERDAFDKYIQWLIKHKAKQLTRRPEFTKTDEEDIEQELHLHLIEKLPKYDPKRASRKTFAARLIERKVASIVRHARAAKRDPRREEFSLNALIKDRDGRRVRRSDLMVDPNADVREAQERALDIEQVMESMPQHLRETASRLAEGSISSIARETGSSRDTIRDHVKAIRRIFEDAGLQDYL